MAFSVKAAEVLNIAIPSDVKAIKIYSELMADFEKQHDINIRFSSLTDMNALMRDKNWFTVKGEPIDIFAGHSSEYLFDFYRQGKILPLNKLWQENHWQSSFSSYKKDIFYDNNYIALPYFVSSRQLFYKETLLTQFAAPPQTMNELTKLCLAFDEKGITPIHISAQTPWLFVYFFEMISLRVHGLDFFKQVSEGKISFLSPEIEKVFTVWKQLISANCFKQHTPEIGHKDVLPYFYRNKIGMIFGRYYHVTDVNNVKVVQDINSIHFPELGHKQRFEPSEVGVFFVNKESKKKALIKQCLTFLASAQTQMVLAEKRGFIPANTQAKSVDSLPVRKLQRHVQTADGLSLASDRSTPAAFYFSSHKPFYHFIRTGDVNRLMRSLEVLRKSVYTNQG